MTNKSWSTRAACVSGAALLTLSLAGTPTARHAAAAGPAPAGARAGDRPVTFNFNFEGASLGEVEKLDDAVFRCHVQGQYDERGRNRQATWFYFRMDHVKGRDVVLTLTDLVGEYNDRPGAVAYGPDIVPVFSDDGVHWRHFPGTEWDDARKEATLRFRPAGDSIRIAHVPPYTPGDLRRLLDDLGDSPCAVVEVIGKTVQGRDIPMVTVTDTNKPDDGKRVVWLQARQHAWEAGTSYVTEGALRFVTSDDPAAAALRQRVVFRFTPMVDLDGAAGGKVRFNANGYDVNRHWTEVDLRRPDVLRLMPEIWYTKRAIVGANAARRIDLMVNLHNTETSEYLATHADDPASLAVLRRLEERLVKETTFDPSRPLEVVKPPLPGDTNTLYGEHRIPVVLMEQRIATSRKLGRRPTVEDRLRFGRELIGAMAGAVLDGRAE
jgi:hypothetical protein